MLGWRSCVAITSCLSESCYGVHYASGKAQGFYPNRRVLLLLYQALLDVREGAVIDCVANQ
jgi:hypothetical protein